VWDPWSALATTTSARSTRSTDVRGGWLRRGRRRRLRRVVPTGLEAGEALRLTAGYNFLYFKVEHDVADRTLVAKTTLHGPVPDWGCTSEGVGRPDVAIHATVVRLGGCAAAGVVACASAQASGNAARVDPLPSWSDTPSKKAIVAFVEKVDQDGSRTSSRPPSASRRSTTTARCGRAADVLPVGLCARRVKALARRTRVEGQGTVRVAPQGRPDRRARGW